MAATFAAASYGLSSGGLRPIGALAVTLGFAAFVIGNWALIRQALKINLAIRADLIKSTNAITNSDFSISIRSLADTANPVWISGIIHLFIDICVVVALWSHTAN
jgi:hypothetical protein